MSGNRLMSERLPGARTIPIDSPAFRPGGRIPRRYTVDGAGISPPLRWGPVPDDTRAVVLCVEDPDAPRPAPFVHWVAYDIDPSAVGLPEDIPGGERPGGIARLRQGPNSRGAVGWMGPAPPPAHGTHHYHFEIFALDHAVSLPDRAPLEELAMAMRGHVLASGELVGTYAR